MLMAGGRGWAQQPIAPVDFRPFVDGRNWICENASDRAKRLLRIIPQDRQSITANTIWPDYQLQLLQPSVVEGPDTQVAPGFCARDDMSVEDALKKQ